MLNIKGLEEAMNEQQNIVDMTGNKYNEANLEGMFTAVNYLGYDWLKTEDGYKLLKRY